MRGVCLTIHVRVMCSVVNQLHKYVCFSAGCIRTESVNKIWDRFLFIFSFRYGEKKSVSCVLFISHVVVASILLKKRRFCCWASLSALIILLHNPQETDSVVMLDMHAFKFTWLRFFPVQTKKLRSSISSCVAPQGDVFKIG